jgi:RNA polymerase sigma factor (sigma-70 family)
MGTAIRRVTTRDDIRLAYSEFRQYYVRERCRWAPENPRRPFQLAIKRLYLVRYRKWMSLWQFMAGVYDTLRGSGKGRGLFTTFDPTKYSGTRPLEKHLLNCFTKRLRAVLRRSLHPRSDNGRKGLRGKFRVYRAHGLRREPTTGARARGFAARRDLEKLPDREWPARGLNQFADTVTDALDSLNEPERNVVELAYCSGDKLSARRIGEALGIDHKTVVRRLATAIRRLRDYYRDELGPDSGEAPV